MAAQKGGDNGANLEANLFIIGIASIVFAILVWLALGKYFSAFMGVVRRTELHLFAPFFEGARDLMGRLYALDGNGLEFVETAAMLTKTGNYVRWLFIPPVVVMAIYLYMKSYRGRFRRRHSMTSLAQQEAKLWPEIAPVAGKQVQMVKGDITKGPWAVAMTEWEFAEKNKLAVRGGKLNRDAARDVFTKQLGPLWTGPQALPVHARAILAAFILRIAGKRDEANAAFRKMAETFAQSDSLKTMDTSWVDAVILEHGAHPNIQKVYQRHAYVFTVMATIQQIARADGVLASPMYLWLKTVDRRLWYTLNNVGRYAFHVECAGIMGHWLFEKTVGAACPSPMVEQAVNGLETALGEYSEDDALERLYQ